MAWQTQSPWLPGVSRCSMQPARLAPAPVPEGRYLGAPAPRSLPAEIRASLQLPAPTSASERRKRSFLQGPPPAGIAAPSPCTPQRSTAARSGTPPRYRTAPAPAASLPRGQRRATALATTPGIRVGRGWWSYLVWGESGMRGASVPLATLRVLCDPHL